MCMLLSFPNAQDQSKRFHFSQVICITAPLSLPNHSIVIHVFIKQMWHSKNCALWYSFLIWLNMFPFGKPDKKIQDTPLVLISDKQYFFGIRVLMQYLGHTYSKSIHCLYHKIWLSNLCFYLLYLARGTLEISFPLWRLSVSLWISWW